MSKSTTTPDPQQPESSATDRLAQRIGGSMKKQLAELPAGMAKMSGVFLDFVSPYRDLLTDKKDRDEFIFLAVTAWNISLAPRKQRKKLIHGFTKMMSEEDPDIKPDVLKAMRILLNELMADKLKYFERDRRFISDYELTNAENWEDCRIAIAFELDK
ncbi:MAG: hypothetical protein WBB82_13655 [Limnothrix sp.]